LLICIVRIAIRAVGISHIAAQKPGFFKKPGFLWMSGAASRVTVQVVRLRRTTRQALVVKI
jgi:hypothetical protein